MRHAEHDDERREDWKKKVYIHGRLNAAVVVGESDKQEGQPCA